MSDINSKKKEDHDYKYYKYIKTPTELGMTSEGSTKGLIKDMNGLLAYTELLVVGGCKGPGPCASKTGTTLGNKFFYNTGGECKDKDTGTNVDRYIYINNVPSGNIPFISSGMGVNFSEFKGLIPGAISNLGVIDIAGIMQAFTSDTVPECQKITLDTIDVDNNRSIETQYIANIDIEKMDPCIFPGNKPSQKKNPVTKIQCKETFETMHINNLPKDYFVQLFFLGLCGLSLFVLFKLNKKRFI